MAFPMDLKLLQRLLRADANRTACLTVEPWNQYLNIEFTWKTPPSSLVHVTDYWWNLGKGQSFFRGRPQVIPFPQEPPNFFWLRCFPSCSSTFSICWLRKSTRWQVALLFIIICSLSYIPALFVGDVNIHTSQLGHDRAAASHAIAWLG